MLQKSAVVGWEELMAVFWKHVFMSSQPPRSGNLKKQGRLDVPEYFDASFKVYIQGHVIHETVMQYFSPK